MADLSNIRLLVCDVDGVMTDGGIILDSEGRELKRFNVRDGSGLVYWRRAGHQAAILTGRTSRAVDLRAAELGISIVEQGAKDKLPALQRILERAGCTAAEAAYMGDDLPDLPPMWHVGYSIAVADAVLEVRRAADHITSRRGGDGAVREAVEFMLRSQGRWDDIMQRYLSQKPTQDGQTVPEAEEL